MEKIIEKINNYLNDLDQQKIVVGIDGYSGVGKTTISNKIGELNANVEVFHMDDYVVTANTKEYLEPQIRNNLKELKLQWKDVEKNGFEQLKKGIEEFKNSNRKKILLVEGIFLFHPDVLNNCFDKIIFLDGDENLADKRRVKREKERWGDKYFSENHPDSFARLFKIAWEKYKELYTPKDKADFVVSL